MGEYVALDQEGVLTRTNDNIHIVHVSRLQ